MKGVENTMNDREMLLRKLSAVSFASWELHIYLDTHECDRDAMVMLQGYEQKHRALVKEYESKFGPLNMRINEVNDNAAINNRWAWTEGPWPWENEKES